VQVLNNFLQWLDLKDAQPFTADQVEYVRGYNGKKRDMTMEELVAAETLRDHYAKPLQDFQMLMDTYWPQVNFSGFSH
jgi:hypothetical protein